MRDSQTNSETILIASWLEAELVERIRRASPWAEVVHEPDLLRPPRYPADHSGHAVERTPEQERAWQGHLARATILFDFDRTHMDDLPDLATRVRWIQATSAGIGQMVRRHDYARRMSDTVFTTASGVHARPLAEFAVLGLLAHSRRLLHTLDAQASRSWARFAGTDLEGRTLLVVGLGSVGREVARLAGAFGMTVLGIRRSPQGVDPATVHVDELHAPGSLHDLLPRAHFVVLAAPHTDDTEALIGAEELACLPRGAVLVNVGRGALVDEPALIDALRSGQLGGAYLDVFATEPLPAESPLWDLPNVLVSPHSGSTSDRENERLTDLFCDNLGRWRDGRPLRNVFEPERLY